MPQQLFPLLARLGLVAQKSKPDADRFDQRLSRIGKREERVTALGLTFKNRPSRRAGAALS